MSERELQEQISALQRQITTMSQYLGAVCEEVLQLQARVQELERQLAAMSSTTENGGNGSSSSSISAITPTFHLTSSVGLRFELSPHR